MTVRAERVEATLNKDCWFAGTVGGTVRWQIGGWWCGSVAIPTRLWSEKQRDHHSGGTSGQDMSKKNWYMSVMLL